MRTLKSTDQNQNWTKRTTFKSLEQKLRHEAEIEVTRQKLTQLMFPWFSFCFDQAWRRDTITSNRVRPGEVTQVPLSLTAVLSTSNFPREKVFFHFLPIKIVWDTSVLKKFGCSPMTKD